MDWTSSFIPSNCHNLSSNIFLFRNYFDSRLLLLIKKKKLHFLNYSSLRDALSLSLPLIFIQRLLPRRVCCSGARGRLPPTGMSMCRTSTSGGSTTPYCGLTRELQQIIFTFNFFFPNSFLMKCWVFFFSYYFTAVFILSSYIAGRMAWLCVPSSTDIDLTLSTTPN